MLEKNSTITLTKEDLNEYNQGRVSQRLLDNWNLSFSELTEIVENKNYTLQE